MPFLYTIGVYGFTPATFFAALHNAGIQTLVDIRWRRGVRGGEYAFANSEALQHRLAELGIGYIYRRDLAPPPEMRQIQYRVDDAHKVAKRKRAVLDQEFARAYETQILKPVDLETLAGEIGLFDAAVALLCVETAPAACHRSIVARRLGRELDRAIQDLVDDCLQPQGVVDIFKAAGIAKPDISILDDAFLQTFKDHPPESLQVKLLERLLADEIERRQRSNLTRSRSFKQTLERTLQEYHNRLIVARAVIEQMIAIKQEMDVDAQRARELGFSGEEMAFYDAIASNSMTAYDQDLLRSLVYDIVQVVKGNLKVDWTEPHRDDVRAAVRAAVKRVLHRRGVKSEDLEPFLGSVTVQAEALYADWPISAYVQVDRNENGNGCGPQNIIRYYSRPSGGIAFSLPTAGQV